MALITRISRLFRADFNAVLDRIEEPDVLLKQSLREMEEDVHSDIQQQKILQHERSQVETKINELEESIVQINQELDICFESNEINLARSQVKRKLEMQRYEKHLKFKINSIANRMSNLEKRIDENKTRLSFMQQKLDLLVDEECQVAGGEFQQNFNATISDDEIEIAILREKQARSTS